MTPTPQTAAVDAAIHKLGIDLLRELKAIAWFCDASQDGRYALIPSDRRHWYVPGGRMEVLTATGCVRLIQKAHCATISQYRPALRMEQFGRQVLVRARALCLNLDAEEIRS